MNSEKFAKIDNKEDMNFGCEMTPVYECPEEKVCHRYIYYDVPHIKPCNTKIINHHVYRHTTVPCYTCCEENCYTNVYEDKKFM